MNLHINIESILIINKKTNTCSRYRKYNGINNFYIIFHDAWCLTCTVIFISKQNEAPNISYRFWVNDIGNTILDLHRIRDTVVGIIQLNAFCFARTKWRTAPWSGFVIRWANTGQLNKDVTLWSIDESNKTSCQTSRLIHYCGTHLRFTCSWYICLMFHIITHSVVY